MTDPTKPSTPEQQTETDRFRRLYAKSMPPIPPPQIEPRHDDTGKYLMAVLGSLIIGIGGLATILYLRPDYDPLLVAGVIFAFLTPTTTSLLSFMKANEVNEQAKLTQAQAVETHLSVNSRLDAFIKTATALAHAEGRKEGELAGAEAANVRTDDLKKAQDDTNKTAPSH